MVLEVKRVYTLTGIKYRYKLGDSTYGEWLIYKNNQPVYYFNIFNPEYAHFVENFKQNFLIHRLKKHGLSLDDHILGIASIKSNLQSLNLDKLPVSVLSK